MKLFHSTQIPLFSKGKSTLQNCLFSVRRLVGKPLQRFGLRRRHRRLWAESPVIFQAAAQAVRFPSSGRDRNGKPGYFTCPAQGQKLGASPREKQVFPVISRQTVYRKTLAKFGAFPVKNFCCNSSGPMPARPCSPFGLIHIPEEQPYDTLIPDFRESRENSERPFLCRRVSLAFPCEIISNHDSVNYD